MMWEKVKIGDVYEGLYDGPHATPPTSDDGAIFLGISNITKDGHIDLSDIKYINENDLPKWTKRVTPKGGDIVFSYEATLNLYAIIPDDFWGCLGRRMALIRPDETKAHGKYLYYYFFSEEWRSTVSSHIITGATVDRIPIDVVSFGGMFRARGKESFEVGFSKFFEEQFKKINFAENTVFPDSIRERTLLGGPNLYGAILLSWYQMHKKSSKCRLYYEVEGAYKTVANNYIELKKYADNLKPRNAKI